MKNFTFVGWITYLLCSCLFREGLFSTSEQKDSRYKNGFGQYSLNSSEQLYSSWSDWTPCSMTCGTGLISRTRKCLKSAYNAKGVWVPLCQGAFAEHKICHLQSCLRNTPSAREQQCSQHDNQVIAGKFVKTWTPASAAANPCELRCESKAEKLVYGFGKAVDGTPCSLGVCLDGRCLSVGCDDRLGSGVTVDMCGICAGRNSSCVHYKDVYQGQPSSGSSSRSSYHEVVVIPMGARNLIIRQPLGKNILALQDRGKGIIFNGEQNSNKYGVLFDIAGSSVEFKKLNGYSEQLIVQGPVNQDLYVLVLLRATNPGIYYEYWLPRHFPNRNPYPSNPQNAVLPTLLSPTTSQSYSVPFYNPAKTTTFNVPYRHPSKPPFAYGYGEKPYKGKEYPIFRHVTSTTRTPTTENKEYPAYPENAKDSPYYPPVKRGIGSHHKPKPILDFYQTFRNVSRFKEPEFPRARISLADLPTFPQDDSSIAGGERSNRNIASSEKNNRQDSQSSKFLKPAFGGLTLEKRENNNYKNYIPNGRLKYSVDDAEVFGNASGRHTPLPLTINVLPLPESKSPSVSKDKKIGTCESCQKTRDQTKHFCISDFVVRALVVGYEFLQGETRYELEVRQTFKNTMSLLPKEYVWSPDTCRCPKLRPGKEYLIMGRSDNGYKKRESRLLVDRNSFVRTFNLKYARRLQKLRKQQSKKCNSPS